MTDITASAPPQRRWPGHRALTLLRGDSLAMASAVFLMALILAAIVGPLFLDVTGVNLRLRNAPPFQLEGGIAYLLGGDNLGRPILPRLLIAARTTLLLTLSVVISSMIAGSALGLVAGYYGNWLGNLILRAADVVMSFPSLLLAVVVLYVLEPSVANVVLVLAITRMPIYIRVARAEVLEVRERLFVESARAVGASNLRIMAVHIVPSILPTLLTVAALGCANVMLAESALSFLGIGVQPPNVTWGLMVAAGRNYLGTAWWLALWPGFAILLTAMATNLLANWFRVAMDPRLRWRLSDASKLHGRAVRRSPAGRNAAAPAAGAGALLQAEDVEVVFRLGGREVKAAGGVSFDVARGETLVILGESGSGKSITCEAILGILESPPGFVVGGRAIYSGKDLLRLPISELRALCGKRIGLVSQDPLSTLNPVFSVGWQIAEMFRVHHGLGRRKAFARAVECLERVGIPDAGRRVHNFPHQFSGGMRQRVGIAMALAAGPEVVIADEPTTALDVTVEAQILDLLKTLQREQGLGLILITHSIGVAAEIADRIAVMYAGKVIETGPAYELLTRPAHPYTQGLLAAIPRLGSRADTLLPIVGQPPDLARIPDGCAFAPRCPRATDLCRKLVPALERVLDEPRSSACHYAKELLS